MKNVTVGDGSTPEQSGNRKLKFSSNGTFVSTAQLRHLLSRTVIYSQNTDRGTSQYPSVNPRHKMARDVTSRSMHDLSWQKPTV